MCRFSIPRSIVSDNGPQFDSRVYRNFCQELKIKNLYSTMRYPQSNGLTKASNKTLLTALEKRLDSAKGKWVDELLGELWAYRTTALKPIGMSPFTITYGMEAIMPTEIGKPTIRTNTLEQGSTELMIKELDTVDELRESATICISSYQHRLERSYNKRVKPRAFQTGDLVLRRVFENMTDLTTRKFQPNWEGPYLITRARESRAYALDKVDGTPIPRMWNATHLKRYYQ